MSYKVRERFPTDNRTIGVVAVAAIALLIAPFVLPAFQTRLLITTLIFAIFATAFNLLYGYTGLLSFGHAMFIAMSAYTTAKFFRYIGPALGFEAFGGAAVLATFIGAIITAVLVTTVLAVLVGYLSVRLEEIYFAMITLSFSMALFVMFNQDIFGSIGEAIGLGALLQTKGSDGLTLSFTLLGEVDLFGWQWQLVDITSYFAYYFIVLTVFAGVMYALWRIVNSPFGTVCQAIRENPDRAEALGIDVTRHSWMTFIASGAFSAFAGALYAPLQGGALPGFGFWTFSAEPVIMTIIGGPYAFLGPLIGAFFVEYTGWILDQLSSQVNALNFLVTYSQFVFGTILLAVVLYFDNGLAGGVEYVSDRIRGRSEADEETKPAD